MRYRASYSIEAAYVMAISMFAIACGICFAYRERDKTLETIIVHEAHEEASHIEPEYDRDVEQIATIEGYALNRMKGVGRLSSTSVSIDRYFGKVNTEVTGVNEIYSLQSDIHDPEDWMRRITSVKEWTDTLMDRGGDED